MKRRVLAALMLVLAGGATAAPAADGPKTWREPLTGMRFAEVPKGCFKMGSDKPQEPQPDYFWHRVGYKLDIGPDERPAHEVCVDAFRIGIHEVTESEWYAIMGGARPQAAGRPVVGIDWATAQAFIDKLNARSERGIRFRLPTEAEWEYACRGGDQPDVNPLEDGADQYAHHRTREVGVVRVGQLKANAFGLYDMLGNAWEWVTDAYQADAYSRHPLYNPKVESGSVGVPLQRVLRGGSVRTENVQTRCAMRGHAAPSYQTAFTGFRLVREK